MKNLLARFQNATRNLDRSQTYLAGISGGRDSVVLLHLLQTAAFENVLVCHLDHGLRKESSAEAIFVSRLALESKMRIKNEKLENVVSGSESSLRRARYAFFARVASETGAAGIFLGHHADDLAETFLWNLLRGSGTAGLSGMLPDRVVKTEAGSIRLLRPMLDFWRTEIDAYAADHALTHVEDRSNRSRKYTRNRLRHDILPWLESQLDRPVRQNLHRAATIFRDENETLDALIAPVSDDLKTAGLLALPIALQRRTILAWLRHHAISDAGYSEVELIRSLLQTGPARINLPGNFQARRRAGRITLASQN